MSAVLPTFLPLAQPHESAVGPPPRTPLSATQTQALEVLIAHFNTVLLPHTLAELKGSRVKLGPAKGYSGLGWFTASKDTVAPDAAAFTALGDVERCFWSREAFERVFRATNWRADDARERAEEIAVWRRDYGVETLSADEIEPGTRLLHNLINPEFWSDPDQSTRLANRSSGGSLCSRSRCC